jgi:hypothetical protein
LKLRHDIRSSEIIAAVINFSWRSSSPAKLLPDPVMRTRAPSDLLLKIGYPVRKLPLMSGSPPRVDAVQLK